MCDKKAEWLIAKFEDDGGEAPIEQGYVCDQHRLEFEHGHYQEYVDFDIETFKLRRQAHCDLQVKCEEVLHAAQVQELQ